MTSARESFEGRGFAHVVAVSIEVAHELREGLARRVDDQVDVVRRPRVAVVGARERAGEHVGDPGSLELEDDRGERAVLGQRESSR
jgi:hypothetical protein